MRAWITCSLSLLAAVPARAGAVPEEATPVMGYAVGAPKVRGKVVSVALVASPSGLREVSATAWRLGPTNESERAEVVERLARIAEGPEHPYLHFAPEVVRASYVQPSLCEEAFLDFDAFAVGRCGGELGPALATIPALAARLDLSPASSTNGVVWTRRFALSAVEEETLLMIARRAIQAPLEGRQFEVPAETILRFPRLARPRACVATISKGGARRGQGGQIEATFPLAKAAAASAITAAFRDASFAPLTYEEFPDIRIALTLIDDLSPVPSREPAKLLAWLDETRPGISLVWRSFRVNQLSDAWEEFGAPGPLLGTLCRGVGAPGDCWRSSEATLETFSERRFEETLPALPVEPPYTRLPRG